MASIDGARMASLRDWEESLKPLKVEIVGDFAGKELFAIHGESLLSHCIPKAKVDFQEGFQLLHAVHAVEAFLSKLKERGCNFDVLWFDSHEHLAIPDNVPEKHKHKYLMARTVLIEHLRSLKTKTEEESDGVPEQNTTTPTMSLVFPTIASDKCRRYNFIMCSSGNTSGLDHASDGKNISYPGVLYLFAKRRYSLAFIDDIEFESSKVYARMVTASSVLPSLDVPEHVPDHAEPLNCARFSAQLELKDLQLEKACRGTESDGRDEIALVACASILASNPGAATERRVAAFLVHVSLLKHGELSQRSCADLDRGVEDADEKFLRDFSSVAIYLIRRRRSSSFGICANWSVYDLVDGRLFLHTLRNLDTMKVVVDVSSYGNFIKEMVGVDLLRHLPRLPTEKLDTNERHHLKANQATTSVLPFSHPVLDPYLKDIQLQTDGNWEDHTKGSRIFQELTHWHNAKVSVDPKKATIQRSADPKVLSRALKRNQRFMAATITYSASLTNASGKNIEPEHIVAQDPPKNNRDKQMAPTNKQQDWRQQLAKKKLTKNKATAGSGRKDALEIAKALKESKNEIKSNAAVTLLASQCHDLDRVYPLVERYLKVSKYLFSLGNLEKEVVGGEVILYACNILAQLVGKPPYSTKDWSIIGILRAQAVEMQALPLTAETMKQLDLLNTALTIPATLGDSSAAVQRPLPFIPKLYKCARRLKISMSSSEFQLQHCGPYMERSFDSAPDPRVPFHPDAWQRKVLDAIDEDKSLFVVAPTSAGKTFISFYAMKKILKANHDDVIVYVAPTKALVNQIAAEIQARFSKSYHREGRSVWAIHTRDYRINSPTGCQVLVTVPHILQIMLLAPFNAKKPDSWSRRVKRIIFDEVHCIGQTEDGIIWEQLLLLAPCPIIALSATVGNPYEFKEWLATAQRAKGFELETVVHASRYSDLRKFNYVPPEDFSFHGFDHVERLPIPGLDAEDTGDDRFVFLHPVGGIIEMRGRDALADTTLEPRDCLQLWQAMVRSQTKSHPVDEALNPENALPETIKKSDIIAWEVALKDKLYEWAADASSPFLQVLAELEITQRPTNEKGLVKTTFPLLVDLRSRGALPAILFNYDRVGCERILLYLLEVLTKGEDQYRLTSPEWKKTMHDFSMWDAVQKNRKYNHVPKKTPNSQEDKSDGTAFDRLDYIREDASKDISPWASFDPSAPIDKFSFADSTKISKKEMEELIEPLKWHHIRKPFVDALRRGLGVHHAGMNRQYRQVVEVLFRKGYLTVVIATGTLALGLNMPCKTVVFTGDSVFLTALNYRQASGRAGRRGFDLLGNVVFHGIPHHRVVEIMSARLPDLKGHFPISVTLVLRLFGLLHGTDGSDYAVNAVQSLLTQTRLFLGGPSSQMSIKHHLRFSIEYLRRQNLLSADGVPLNFSGLVGHLYFTENAVFAFHSLMEGGYLHELCGSIRARSDPKDVLVELVNVLCHLFCRIPCYRYMNKTWLEKVVHRSPSVVFLPRLPENAERILRNHNRETLEIFQTYVRSYVDQHLHDVVDNELPFTKRRVGPQKDKRVDIAATGLPVLPATVIRSPFAALSGFTDDFATIHELCETVRGGVFLEEASIPYIPIYPDETDGVPFNAYILDFFKHGDLKALVSANGIKSGDVWFLLKDFSLILATIVASLENFMGMNGAEFSDDAMIDVQDAGDVMEEEDGDREDIFSKVAEFEPTKAPEEINIDCAKKKSNKVADSWEDEDDSEDESGSSQSVDESGSTPASWDDDGGGKSLMDVYIAFGLLQKEFDAKFKKVWA